MRKHSENCMWQQDWSMCGCGALDDLIDLNQQFDHQTTSSLEIKPWYNCAYCEAGYPDQGCTCGDAYGDTCGKSN